MLSNRDADSALSQGNHLFRVLAVGTSRETAPGEPEGARAWNEWGKQNGYAPVRVSGGGDARSLGEDSASGDSERKKETRVSLIIIIIIIITTTAVFLQHCLCARRCA